MELGTRQHLNQRGCSPLGDITGVVIPPGKCFPRRSLPGDPAQHRAAAMPVQLCKRERHTCPVLQLPKYPPLILKLMAENCPSEIHPFSSFPF